MLGDKEKGRVKWWEEEILNKVTHDLQTLKSINPEYAKRILKIFYYPDNNGNTSYVKKILENSEKLEIPTQTRDDIHRFWKSWLYKNTRSISNASWIWAVFITNPIGEFIGTEDYQRAVDRTETKDIDGQSTKNKMALKNINTSLEWHIVHPTALSVLFLIQKTLDSKDLTGKTILIAGKNGNFGSMIATLLERAGATTIGFNPRGEKKESRHQAIRLSDAVVSVIRKANYFTQDYFERFDGPIIDVTTEADEFKRTTWSVDIQDCKDIPNIYIPSINGGVGTTTSALLMQNFARCIINTETTHGADTKIFEDLKNMNSYIDFWLEVSTITDEEVFSEGEEIFWKEWFIERLNTSNRSLWCHPITLLCTQKGKRAILDTLIRITHGVIS